MLANGIKLGFKKTGGSSFTDLTGLKEVPEMGDSPEKVDNTTLADKKKQYEYGIPDAGELEFKFKYENTSESSPYRIMRKAAADKEVLTFQETFPDGTTFVWDAQVNVKIGSGAVNGVIDWTLGMALQSDIEVTDPTVPSGS